MWLAHGARGNSQGLSLRQRPASLLLRRKRTREAHKSSVSLSAQVQSGPFGGNQCLLINRRAPPGLGGGGWLDGFGVRGGRGGSYAPVCDPEGRGDPDPQPT
jgi:hypothetical protein